MDDYERVLLVKNEVFVYRIPPLSSTRGFKAADWKLDAPDFTGRMRLTCNSNQVTLKLEDKISGELFAKCPIQQYPGSAIVAVQDSSRYFVLKIADDSGRTAVIGIGFADRGDSFDLNVALQDHFKHVEKDQKLVEELAKESGKPKLDLGFKEGQTITINLGNKSTSSVSRPKSSNVSGGSGLFSLPPPPPAGSRITYPSSLGLDNSNSFFSITSTNAKQSPSDTNPFGDTSSFDSNASTIHTILKATGENSSSKSTGGTTTINTVDNLLDL